MPKFVYSSLLSLFFACTVLSCPSKFKNSTGFLTTVATQCILKLKISDKNVEKVTELLKDPDHDDMCLSKCLLEKLDVVNIKGVFDRDAIFDYLEEQAPKNLLTKLTEIVNKCADSSEIDKIVKDPIVVEKQTTPPPPPKPSPPPALPNYDNKGECKIYHDFYSCFTTNAEKLC